MSSAAVQADCRLVSLVRVVVHTAGVADPTISDNRWSIYLIFLDVDGSVRFTMMGEYGNPTGYWNGQPKLMLHQFRHETLGLSSRSSRSSHSCGYDGIRCTETQTSFVPSSLQCLRESWISVSEEFVRRPANVTNGDWET
jgi:hypothetical protein